MYPMTELLRPRQWIKNFFVFAGIIFAQQLGVAADRYKVLGAFALFCMLSSSVYLVNDVIDVERDRLHPDKKFRPLPSGRVRRGTALSLGLVLGAIALALSFLLEPRFALVGATYLALMLAYSLFLKNIAFVDVFVIASGFVMRAIAGAVVIHVQISEWLLFCTFNLALLLAMGKRRAELVQLNEDAANHRGTLSEYNPAFLEHLVSIAAGVTIVSYGLYTLDQVTIQKFHTHRLVYSVPFVIFGIFRYLYLIHLHEQGGNPTETAYEDRPLLITILLWLLVVSSIIYFR